MKIVVTSDIHLSITSYRTLDKLVRRISKIQPDVFIAAGDLGELGGHYMKCIERLAKIDAGQKAVMAGNHDLWTKRPDIATSKVLWDEILPGVAEHHGMIWLEDGKVITHDNIGIVGSIAWYDYSAASNIPPDLCRISKAQYNNDAVYMDKDWDDVKFAWERRVNLCYSLGHLECQDEIEHTVVVTHVPIFPQQQARESGDSLEADAYFYNFSLGKVVLKFDKVHTVISGHTHRAVDTTVGRGRKNPVRAIVVPSKYHAPGIVELEL